MGNASAIDRKRAGSNASSGVSYDDMKLMVAVIWMQAMRKGSGEHAIPVTDTNYHARHLQHLRLLMETSEWFVAVPTYATAWVDHNGR